MAATTPPEQQPLWHPRYWPSWLAIVILRLIAALPFKAKIIAGRLFGNLAFYLVKGRRHIVETNVRLCFSERSEAEQKQLVRDIFVANGIGFFEIAWAWWVKPHEVVNKFSIEGLEHLEAAKAEAGVVVVGAHFVHLDLVGFLINQVTEMDVIYRKNNNPVFEHVITGGRKRVFKNILERSDMRAIVRKLREGRAIWYSPDQDFGANQAVFAPFFGVSAATLTTTSRLAKMGKAKTVVLLHFRDPVSHRYKIIFEPVAEEFPSGDDVHDATLINAQLERGIRRQPDQYMWVHRRFKTRPPGEPSLY